MKRYLTILLAAAAAAVVFAPTLAHPALTAPTGVTAFAQDGSVTIAWQPVSGATGYRVYRGTSAGSITTLVGSPTSASYTDTATNNTTYYYAVTTMGGGESVKSSSAQAKPTARSCSTGNAVVVENCYPGSTGWKLTNAGRAYDNGIEGFATATSINQGGSVDLKVNTGPSGDNVPYHIDIYRMGWYGGSHGRLVSSLPGLKGVAQDSCQDGSGNTGLLDCSNWDTTSKITTTTAWPSGVYWLRLVRDDNGADNSILLVVRKDGSTSQVVYGLPTSTYQAYNNYGGKSLYTWNSSGDPTVSGTARAVKVSYDRPYTESYNGQDDFFPFADMPNVGFLERQGYDVTYITSTDMHTSGSQLNNHKAYISPAHDEYFSTEMRTAVTNARTAGTGIFFLGSNQVYWKIRYEASPFSSTANRVEVGYKTTESGATDPVSPTGTWRDPAGANQPENALVGNAYVGDDDSHVWGLTVTAAQGKTRVWRHTALANQAAGTSTDVGTGLVGWEWNDRVSNGSEPAGTTSFFSTATTGEILQSDGHTYAPGAPGKSTGTYYKAASGAWVVSTGTNYWSRGLDVNDAGTGEPRLDVQQATTNILSDMGSTPTTPISGIVADTTGAPTLSASTPTAGATGVAPSANITATMSKSLDPSTVTTTNVTVTPTAGGAALAATVSYDDATQKITLDPTGQLDPFTAYTVKIKGGSTGVASWTTPVAADITWTFTSGSGTPPTVLSTTPDAGASSVSIDGNVTATFDRSMDATTLTGTTVNLRSAAGTAVPASVSYNASTRVVTLDPTAALDPTTQYVATVTSGAKATDGTALAADVSWTFTTATALTLTTRTPAPLATGISPGTQVRAVFSTAVDASTLTSSSFKLTNSGGTQIAATIGYDATTTAATLTPNAALALGTTYTVTVSTAVTATDGTHPAAAISWTFTTAATAPTAPTVTSLDPAASATGVALDASLAATYDRALDPSTVTGSSVLLRDNLNATVAATVSYDAGAKTIRLTPLANLAAGKVYTGQLTTAIRAADGTPMAAAVSWTFTTADCPCSLMGSTVPTSTNNDVRDGRGGTGPWTYEMGTKVTPSVNTSLVAVRYYKDPGETGTHIGRVWNASGTQLAQVTYDNESASGWQRQALTNAITLTAGQTYTISVGLNTKYVLTTSGLATPVTAGPWSSVAGSNGVYAATAGTFPTSSWNNSNYFVDGVVKTPGSNRTPQVTTRTPASGATNVDQATTVTATFSTAMDAATVSSSTVKLATAGGTAVPATVTYSSATRTATLTPSSLLDPSASYTATLTTGLRSDDETALPAAVSWSFSTTSNARPTVSSTVPVSGATGVGTTQPVKAVFSVAVDPTTVTGSSFTLTGPGGSSVPATVSYDAPTKTATLTPTAALSGTTAYTATLSTAITGTNGQTLLSPVTWSFTTSACPCMTMASLTPAVTNLDVRDGRGGTGPWTYEMGTKIQVVSAASLNAIRFYKDPGETGTHVGTLWDANGGVVAQVTFTGESASGWQQQALSSPVALSPNATYVVSVGFNTKFTMTSGGLANILSSGPLQTIAGGNGVYGNSAGTFPTGSYASSNYFVDAVVQ
ncbi:Ig-like domain-containing protein [Baekduia sp.]|jgi:hypothetical protein|uniref:Ig-like domain-containing protein n=1 Tax=Baekduia sp. TaxID=2600305 RepID=UPI002E08C793|nr:Ig-like domain-containing protein [Baekduia sp.]